MSTDRCLIQALIKEEEHNQSFKNIEEEIVFPIEPLKFFKDCFNKDYVIEENTKGASILFYCLNRKV